MNRHPDVGVLTTADAARELKVSEATIRRMVQDGRLTPLNLGRRVLRFSRMEIDRVIHGD